MIRHIVAVDEADGFARVGDPGLPYGIPWQIPDDLEHFHTMTQRFGGHLLVGRATMDAIGRSLDGRHTYVLTHNPQAEVPEGAEIVTDLQAFLSEMRASGKELWVGGGQALYEAIEPDEIYLTRVRGTFDCNRTYPDILHKFQLVEVLPPMQQKGYEYQFQIWKK